MVFWEVDCFIASGFQAVIPKTESNEVIEVSNDIGIMEVGFEGDRIKEPDPIFTEQDETFQ